MAKTMTKKTKMTNTGKRVGRMESRRADLLGFRTRASSEPAASNGVRPTPGSPGVKPTSAVPTRPA
ncbi:hypothetical protein Bra471DRAFT_00729 [Bradyrhizobium sp. WSM471]|nr:hypothetical protein Bra471DRAFT_00729 [Bradyrhizobium sp. WSM471]